MTTWTASMGCLLGCLVLAACATPEARCAGPALPQLSAVQDEIAAEELVLARGYRVEDPAGITIGVQGCTGGNVRFCLGKQVRPGERVVAVDPAVSRARLLALRAEEAQLRKNVTDRVRACAP
jgi:hypothetical protein